MEKYCQQTNLMPVILKEPKVGGGTKASLECWWINITQLRSLSLNKLALDHERGNYSNLDYRDVTSVKHNGMDSPESSRYKLKMNYGRNNLRYINECKFIL